MLFAGIGYELDRQTSSECQITVHSHCVRCGKGMGAYTSEPGVQLGTRDFDVWQEDVRK